jgi:hypothetical protein
MEEEWEICPPKERLVQYAQGQLQGKLNEWTYRHLKFCRSCMGEMAKIKRIPSPEEIIQEGGWMVRLRNWWSRLRGR